MNILTSIKTWKIRRRENRWTYEKEQEYQKLKAELAALEMLSKISC